MPPVSPFQLAGDALRVAFLTELLRGASASEAAARAGLNRGSVYRWKLEDPEFAAVWAEIVAARPRRRHLRRRVLGRRRLLPARHPESSQPVSPAPGSCPAPEAAGNNDLAAAFGRRR
jgi:hypothetical protein